MSVSMSKKIRAQGLSWSQRMDEETMLVQKQGIVTILGSDWERNKAGATSLRRTLSADMSSKKWLSQNGLKKITSSEELSQSKLLTTASADSLSSSEGEDDYQETKELDQIWSSIQRDKKEQHEQPAQFDLWSSMLSQKANEETSNSFAKSTPYIHPLVKKSKSSLCQKSLEICTESLGSETGSDGFSSYPPSETEEDKEEEEEEQEQQQQQQPEEVTVVQANEEDLQNLQVPKYNYAVKKSQHRSFPPPLPSLHMLSHRHNGRLFLEAVSLPSHNNFCAQRQDGRLVLTFAGYPNEDDGEVAEEEEEEVEKDHVEELEEEIVGFEEDIDKEEKEHDEDDEEIGEVENDARDVETSGITNVHTHRLALTTNEAIGLVNNRNPKWLEKIKEVVNFEDVNLVQHSPVAHSLPPRPRLARLIPSIPAVASAVASFNAYECYWRTKATAKAALVPNQVIHQQNNYSSLKNNCSKLILSGDINQTSNDRQQLLVLRGKNGDYLVHNLKSCKDSRRSFLFLEPYCIAT